MIEKLVNSKTRIKILKLFLSHIEDRYYLRELERMLEESLSPLRRQLVKLTRMGILVVEEEANLKYYRVNKNFEGLEDLKKIILEKMDNEIIKANEPETVMSRSEDIVEIETTVPKHFRYDLVLLSFISFFVLTTAIFVVYSNMKNIKQVTNLISKGTVLDSAKYSSSEVEKDILPRSNNIGVSAANGEMASKKWKVLPGNVPVLSSGETGEDKKSKEL